MDDDDQEDSLAGFPVYGTVMGLNGVVSTTNTYANSMNPPDEEPDEELVDDEPLVTPSEAVIAFAWWLSDRGPTLVCGKAHPSDTVEELAIRFCIEQGYDNPRDDFFPENITEMPQETESFVSSVQRALDLLRNP